VERRSVWAVGVYQILNSIVESSLFKLNELVGVGSSVLENCS
jgi:hypothetical protein